LVRAVHSRPAVTRSQYDKVCELLREGGSYYGIGKQLSMNPNTVRMIAQKAGLDRSDVRMTEAIKAKQVYTKERRLEIADRAFELLDQMLGEVGSPKDMQAWVSAFSQMVDKHRLEDGEATARTEVVTDQARQAVRDRLDAVVERRSMLKVVGGNEVPALPLPGDE
jgi:cobalamin biosynthesis Mg chelatase CobN